MNYIPEYVKSQWIENWETLILDSEKKHKHIWHLFKDNYKTNRWIPNQRNNNDSFFNIKQSYGPNRQNKAISLN